MRRGGGVGLVACCDIAIGAEGAKFGLTEVRLGLAPAVIAPFVVRAIGARQARRYFLSGERFDSATWMLAGPHGMNVASLRSRIRSKLLCTCVGSTSP